jgi:hypothetical protein
VNVARQYKWTVPTDRLRAVAEWFDTIGPLLESKEVFAQCITMWVFDWLDEDDSVPVIQRPINMFGIQLYAEYFHDLRVSDNRQPPFS